MASIGITRAAGPVREDLRGPAFERTGFRLSWGSIFAGFAAATGIQVVLTTLGTAVGLAAFDPAEGDRASALGIGAALWFAVAAIISMYVGGLTTGRLAGVLTRGDGMLHGVLMWSVSVLFAIYLGSAGAGRVLGGVASLLGQTVSSVAGGAVSGAGMVGATTVQQGGVNVSPEQRQNAQETVQRAQQQIQQQAPEIQARASEVAGQAAHVASRALWSALLVMGLSVGAAVLGARRTAPE
jgi:hypothetical protein